MTTLSEDAYVKVSVVTSRAVMANQPWNSVVYEDDTEIAIIGGGVCGTLLAGRCAEQNINFTIIDRQATLGGVWLEYANQHSSLQVGAEISGF